MKELLYLLENELELAPVLEGIRIADITARVAKKNMKNLWRKECNPQSLFGEAKVGFLKVRDR